MIFQDKTLECSDCEKEFTFSAEEQEQFHYKGYTHDPKRCRECRQARKARQNRYSSNSYGNSSYDYRAPRQMFSVVCSRCGNQTKVPFQPRVDSPVYCSDCYRKTRNTNSLVY